MGNTTLYFCDAPDYVEYEIEAEVSEGEVVLESATADGKPVDLDKVIEMHGGEEHLQRLADETHISDELEKWEGLREEYGDRQFHAKKDAEEV